MCLRIEDVKSAASSGRCKTKDNFLKTRTIFDLVKHSIPYAKRPCLFCKLVKNYQLKT